MNTFFYSTGYPPDAAGKLSKLCQSNHEMKSNNLTSIVGLIYSCHKSKFLFGSHIYNVNDNIKTIFG
jgi:hypothetical protein